MFKLQPKFDVSQGISAIETFSALANTALSTAARITALNLNTSLSILEHNLALTKALGNIKNLQGGLQGLSAIDGAFTQPNLEKIANYSRELIEIAQQSGVEVNDILRSEKNVFRMSLPSNTRKAA